MKAIQVTKYGEGGIFFNQNIPNPTPKEEQILLEIHAAAINPFDTAIQTGAYQAMMPMQFPYIPGGDFAGVVIAVGPGVTLYKTGDEVFGTAAVVSGGSGSFAEKAVAKLTGIAKKPAKLDFIQSASLPLVGSSAVQALEEHMGLKSGQKILIHGGAGGIGTFAIQLAKHIGAYVATTVSEKDKDFVATLGADQVIDYKTEHFQDLLKDFDAVYDTVGGETTTNSFKVLKKGGVLVSMKGKPSDELAAKYSITVVGQGTHTNTQHLTRVADLVDSGSIKPQIDKIFQLNQAAEVFEYQTKNKPRGKVVLQIK